MKNIYLFPLFALVLMLNLGCNEGVANPFTGSQWTAGSDHASFSHAVANWDTANNRLVLKFDLLSGSSYPDATATVENISTLAVNTPRDVVVHLSVSNSITYNSGPGYPNAQATITFTRLDLTTLGAVSGTITGKTQRLENPSDAPVDLNADFDSVPVAN